MLVRIRAIGSSRCKGISKLMRPNIGVVVFRIRSSRPRIAPDFKRNSELRRGLNKIGFAGFGDDSTSSSGVTLIIVEEDHGLVEFLLGQERAEVDDSAGDRAL